MKAGNIFELFCCRLWYSTAWYMNRHPKKASESVQAAYLLIYALKREIIVCVYSQLGIAVWR